VPAEAKIRLCVITQDLASGGIETRMARLLSALPRSDFELSWLSFHRGNPHLLELAGSAVEVEILPRHRTRRGVDARLLLRVAESLRRLRPDIVHVHNWSTSIYGILGARLAGVRRVIFESGGREQPEGATRRQRLLMSALAPHVDQLCSVCDLLSREMDGEWGVPAGSTRTMPTGIDLDRFERGDRRDARRALGLPQDAIVVGTVAMSRPIKRLDDLVAAAIPLMRADPRVHLLIIGSAEDGTISPSLRDAVARAGLADRTHLLGRLESTAQHLAAFDVFVNCSAFEGLSNAIIEAMASSLAIVATRVGGTPELITDGEHGLLVPAGAPELLGQAMARLVADDVLRQRLGKRASEQARARHGIAQMAEAYLQLHRELVARRSDGAMVHGINTVLGVLRSVGRASRDPRFLAPIAAASGSLPPLV